MAKIKPFYNSESEIPAAVKEFYVQEGDKWVLDGGEETLGPYYNVALDAKKKEIIGEKDRAVSAKEAAQTALQNANNTITQLQTKLNDKDQEINRLQAPGQVSIPAAEKKNLDDYKALGTPKEVKDKVELADEFTTVVTETLGENKKPGDVKTALTAKAELETRVANHERDTLWGKAAEAVEFNFSVLKDLMTHPERNAGILEIVMEDVTEGEGENKTTKSKPFVIAKGKTEGEKVRKALEEYATERSDWATYLPALKKAADENGGGGQQPRQDPPPLPKIPTGGPSKRATSNAKSPIEEAPNKFNEARNTRKDPFNSRGPAAPAATQ